MVGQSDPLFVPKGALVKAITLSTDYPAREDLLQKNQERVDKLSQQNRVIKICTAVNSGTATRVHHRSGYTDVPLTASRV